LHELNNEYLMADAVPYEEIAARAAKVGLGAAFMTDNNTASNDPKQRVTTVFNTIAATYDTLRYVRVCAQRVIELAPLAPGARVLDIATGTGLVAMVAAEIVGPTGSVTGIDISPEMLALARQKRPEGDLASVDFREGDAERLEFPDQSFDIVLCASSLYYVPDMMAALREARRVLVPGGCIGFSSFGSSFLYPLQGLWNARVQQYGVKIVPQPTHRLTDPMKCQQMLAETGFAQIEVRSEQLGYYLPTAEDRWSEILASLEGVLLRQIDPSLCKQFKTEHLAELAALTTPQGLWVDVPAHFAFGWRPT
jgi:arsenite methyltransferase